MNTTIWLAVCAAILLLGGGAGAAAGVHFARRGLKGEIRRAVETVEQKYGASLEQHRAAKVRVQSELDQTRANFKRQLVAAAAEPNAQMQRSEERLKAAYAELDRLRAQINGPDTAGYPDVPDGFALTQPMPTGRR